MLKNRYPQPDIAATIAKDKSVVSRELKRNADARSGEYGSDLAQRKTDRRHKQKPKKVRFTDHRQGVLHGDDGRFKSIIILFEHFQPICEARGAP